MPPQRFLLVGIACAFSCCNGSARETSPLKAPDVPGDNVALLQVSSQDDGQDDQPPKHPKTEHVVSTHPPAPDALPGQDWDSPDAEPLGNLLVYDRVVKDARSDGNYAYLTFWYEPEKTVGSLLGQEVRDTHASSEESDLCDEGGAQSDFRGIIKLAEQLGKVNSKYPLAVATNNQKLIDIIEESPNMTLIPITGQDILQGQRKCEKKNHLQKLWVFGLTNYEKYLYLDADVEVKENVDHLFDEDLNGGRKIRVQRDDWTCNGTMGVCSGVMLFQPSEQLRAGLIAEVSRRDRWTGDQWILDSFLREKPVGAAGFEHPETGEVMQYQVGFFPLNVVSFGKCNQKSALSHHTMEHQKYDLALQKNYTFTDTGAPASFGHVLNVARA